MKLFTVLAVYFSTMMIVMTEPKCTDANWVSSFDHPGKVQCDAANQFITGIYRGGTEKDEDIKYLDKGKCCTGSGVWEGKDKTLTFYAVWERTLDREYSWARCPSGHFLQGFYRGGEKNRLHNIEGGLCSRPIDHPTFYGECKDHYITECMKHEGWCKCPDDYYVAGFRRGGCDALRCLDAFKCCKMVASIESEPYDITAVQYRVMEVTLTEMATLANYLGFAWPYGCGAQRIGQDFVKDSFKWTAGKSADCSGDKSGDRLQIAYDDWGYETASIAYGEPKNFELEPESVDGGDIYNNLETNVTHVVTRILYVEKSVTHVVGQSFQFSKNKKVEISLDFKMPGAFGNLGASFSYSFGYETQTKRVDKNGKKDSKAFMILASYTIMPKKATRWSLLLFKAKTIVSYKAKIQIKFSASFKNFLRSGDLSDPKTNYHQDYRNSGKKSDSSFTYKFGDSNRPFYKALHDESYYNSAPWLWASLKMNAPKVNDVIKSLTNGSRYTFDLNGKFLEITGTRTKFHFQEIPDAPNKKPDDIIDSGKRNIHPRYGTSQIIARGDPSYKVLKVLTAPHPRDLIDE